MAAPSPTRTFLAESIPQVTPSTATVVAHGSIIFGDRVADAHFVRGSQHRLGCNLGPLHRGSDVLFLFHSAFLFNDFLSVNDIYALCGVLHAATLEVVDNCCLLTVVCCHIHTSAAITLEADGV